MSPDEAATADDVKALCAGGSTPLRPPESFDPQPVKRGEVRQSRMGRRRAVVLLLVALPPLLAVLPPFPPWPLAVLVPLESAAEAAVPLVSEPHAIPKHAPAAANPATKTH